MKNMMEEKKTIILFLIVYFLLLLAGCTNSYITNNPRNMQNMSTEQIEQELTR